MQEDDPGKALKFPLSCQFRIMAFASAKNIPADTAKIVKEFKLATQAKKANLSKNGTYQTWQLPCTIKDLETLRAVGAALGAIDGVKMVL